MRIISGTAKGRVLFAPEGKGTRPTSDKLRGSLFNILGASVIGVRVLDLFGGTGALALEAFSRGASFCAIADSDRRATDAITRNARNVAGDDFSARVRIIKADYRRAISVLKGLAFDLVFLDPPYVLEGAYADAESLILSGGLASENCVFICERGARADIMHAEGLKIYDTRAYGETCVDFLRRENLL